MKNKLILLPALFALLLSVNAVAADQSKEIRLWPNGAPGSEGKAGEEAVRVTPQGEHVVSNIHHPSLTPYLPPKEKATGAATKTGQTYRKVWPKSI